MNGQWNKRASFLAKQMSAQDPGGPKRLVQRLS